MFGWKVERKRKLLGTNYFLFGSTKLQSLQNREKIFVHVKIIFGLWCFATRSSFLFSFSTPPTSFIHFGLLFIFFYFLFLVSSCFPFYASIFFSFFFTSFLFLFLFFLIYLLASASSLRFYLFFFSFFFFNIIIWMPLFFSFFELKDMFQLFGIWL